MRSFVLTRLSFTTLLVTASIALSGCTTISTLIETYGSAPEAAPTPTAAPSYAPTGIVELAIGDCLDQHALEDGITATEPVVDCEDPHDLEVYAELTVEDGEYPAVEKLVRFATKGCAAEFADFVGLDFGISALDFQYYYPTESSWANGDRGIDCVVFDPTKRSTDTLADAKR